MAEGVRKRGNKWSYYFDTARVNGERRKIEKSGFATQKEALDARAAAIAEYNNTGRVFTVNSVSLADYLDYWLEKAIKKNIDRGYTYNTYINYESKIRLHIKPALGAYRLTSLQYAPDKIQSWIDNMKSNGYAKSMIKNTLTCLQGALNYAITPLNYIQANPCYLVKIGRIPIKTDVKAKTEYVCPKEEFDKIISRFPFGSGFHLALLLPYHTGTRLSETFCVDLNTDIDFDRHELNINGQLVKIENTWFVKPPKYESYRTIKIDSTIEYALKRELLRQKENRLKFGKYYIKTYRLPDNSILQARSDIQMPYTEISPLCVKNNGELLTPESFKYCARVIHYELNNHLFHSHCLRHTHGTILAENGVNPKTVMERLGHKDIKTTLQTYTFNTDLMQKSAVDVLEKYL